MTEKRRVKQGHSERVVIIQLSCQGDRPPHRVPARGHLSEMPGAEGLIAQTANCGRTDFFGGRQFVCRAPEPNAARRVSSCRLKIAQIVKCACNAWQAPTANAELFSSLARALTRWAVCISCPQLARQEKMAPLTDQCRIEKQGAIQRVTQGFHPLVTKTRFRCGVSSGSR